MRWFRRSVNEDKNESQELINKAHEADKILRALGVEPHTTTGRQIRSAIALELLGQKYELMEKYGKAVFLKQNIPVLDILRDVIKEEGVLSQSPAKEIEDKKVGK